MESPLKTRNKTTFDMEIPLKGIHPVKTIIQKDSCIPRDFPGGIVDKNPPASPGDTVSIPGLGRLHVLRSN